MFSELIHTARADDPPELFSRLQASEMNLVPYENAVSNASVFCSIQDQTFGVISWKKEWTKNEIKTPAKAFIILEKVLTLVSSFGG